MCAGLLDYLRPAVRGGLPELLRERPRGAHGELRAGAPADLPRRPRSMAALRALAGAVEGSARTGAGELADMKIRSLSITACSFSVRGMFNPCAEFVAAHRVRQNACAIGSTPMCPNAAIRTSRDRNFCIVMSCKHGGRNLPMSDDNKSPMDRRSLLKLIGTAAGSAVMYQAMSELGYAGESDFTGPDQTRRATPKAPRCSSSAQAGRAWLRPTSCAKPATRCRFSNTTIAPAAATGRSMAATPTPSSAAPRSMCSSTRACTSIPGPWRMPHHHRAILYYCKLLNVPLEPFMQVNYAAYVQSAKAFGGKPKRYREVQADFNGYVAETARQSHEPVEARSGRHAGRPGTSARGDAGLGRARRELRIQEGPALERTARLGEGSGRRAQRHAHSLATAWR